LAEASTDPAFEATLAALALVDLAAAEAEDLALLDLALADEVLAAWVAAAWTAGALIILAPPGVAVVVQLQESPLRAQATLGLAAG
jgi:hypothetical protein